MQKQLIQQIKDYLHHLYTDESYDLNLEMSVWKNNPFIYDYLSVTQCTSSAMLLAHRFGGQVFGYPLDLFNVDENKNLLGCHSGGHDFCVVDNLLIDYWAKYVDNPKRKAIIDLTNPYEWGYLQKYYLPLDRWEHLKLWDK